MGWRYAESTLLVNLGNIHFELGSYNLAHDAFQQAVHLSRQIGDVESESIAHDTLGMVDHYQERYERARGHYEAALALAEQIQNERNRGYTLTHLGFTLLALGRLDAAAECLERARLVRQSLGNEASVMDTLSGLAAVAAAQDRLDEAQRYVEQIMAWIGAHSADSLELPIQTYGICYDILRRVAAREPATGSRAGQVLAEGHTLLQQRAKRINDTELRRQFLEQVPFNRRLNDAWLAANEPPRGSAESAATSDTSV
jgi:tetratricopeptide (TPR) repeat protein